ncbi:MAG TPA: inositol monophosphatase [Bryobacteraceae bacterium]|nr:inositol monophosphatase [Bryobacteraceae bacterium]
MAYERELEFALAIARRAGEIALEHQRGGVTAETKSDLSPVTAADRASERLIAEAIRAEFPEDGLLGEEGSDRQGQSGRRWIIDPIDGTREFVRGNPAWSILLALEEAGDVKVGIAHFPATDATYRAVRGQGAFLGDTRLRASGIRSAAQAVLCINGFDQVRRFPFAAGLLEWLAEFWAVRSFGGCMDAVMVASGKADAWIEPKAEPWDIAALRLIGEEAGAVFFNLDGGCSLYAGNAVLCAPAMESEMRRFLVRG